MARGDGRKFSGLVDECLVGLGDGFEVDIPLEAMDLAQGARDRDDLLHRVVGIANDSRAEKKTFNVISPIEIKREVHDFLDGETSARHGARDAIYAVKAVVSAVVGEKNFEQRNAAAVRGVAMADSCACR